MEGGCFAAGNLARGDCREKERVGRAFRLLRTVRGGTTEVLRGWHRGPRRLLLRSEIVFKLQQTSIVLGISL